MVLTNINEFYLLAKMAQAATRALKKQPVVRRPEIDVLLRDGSLSLRAISRELEKQGITACYETVRVYAIDTDQDEDYRRRRIEFREELTIQTAELRAEREAAEAAKEAQRTILRSEAQNLVDTLAAITVTRAHDERGWAYGMAIQHRLVHGPTKGKYSLTNMLKFFRMYPKASSLKELANHIGVCVSTAHAITRRMSLEAPAGTRPRIDDDPVLAQTLDRAYETDLSVSDVAYICEVDSSTLAQRFRKRGKRKVEPTIFKGLYGGGLPVRVQMQVYEAADLLKDEFGKKSRTAEIADLLDFPERQVDCALAHRRELSPRIIRNLRIISPDRNIRTPYLR